MGKPLFRILTIVALAWGLSGCAAICQGQSPTGQGTLADICRAMTP